MDVAELFDRMARSAGIENLSGFSTRRLYELFARLAEAVVKDEDRDLMVDALFYDYCRSEMPLMGKLPSFIAKRGDDCVWCGRKDLPAGLDLPEGGRIKSFRFRFLRDYRREALGEPTEVTFVYVSGAGRGLRVLVV
jgi:hypothetical protein